MFGIAPIQWLGFVIIIQTAIMWLYIREIDINLEKILKILEAKG